MWAFPSSVAITYPEQVHQFCNSSHQEAECTLWRGTSVPPTVNITDMNDTYESLSATTWYYNATVPETQNYSAAHTANNMVVVSQNTSTANYIILLLDGTAANETVTYPNVTNATAHNMTSVFDSQSIDFTLLRDGVNKGTNGVMTDRLSLPNGTYNYTLNTSGNQNYTAGQIEYFVFVLKNSSTSTYLHLLLDGTAANETVTYMNVSNATAYNDSSVFDSQSITFTLYRNGVLIGTNGVITDRLRLGNDTWNYTYNTTGNANYSAGQVDYSVLVLKNTTGHITAFEINDFYINFNETVIINVTAPHLDVLYAEMTTSGVTKNLTLLWDGTFNYTDDIEKADLGDTTPNATQVNITRLYFGGSNYTQTTNSTGTMNFSYGTTEQTIGDTPDPITNAAGQAVSIWSYYNSTEGDALTGSTCRIDLFGAWTTMGYDATDGRYEGLISTTGKAVGIHTYNVSCTNSSYGSQSLTGTVDVRTGLAGGDGGGVSGYSSCKAHNNICLFDTECCSPMLCSNYRCLYDYEIDGIINFDVKPRVIEEELTSTPIRVLSRFEYTINVSNNETVYGHIPISQHERLYPRWDFTCTDSDIYCMSNWCVAAFRDPMTTVDGILPQDYALVDMMCVIPSDVEGGFHYSTTMVVWADGYSRNISKDVSIRLPIREVIVDFEPIVETLTDTSEDITGMFAKLNYTRMSVWGEKAQEVMNFNVICLTKACADERLWFFDVLPQPLELGPFVIMGITPSIALAATIITILLWYVKRVTS